MRAVLWTFALIGWRQVYPGRFDPNHTVKLVAEEEVKALAGVPTMLYMLLTAPELPKYLAKIREIKPIFVVGGAALPKELAKKAVKTVQHVSRGLDVLWISNDVWKPLLGMPKNRLWRRCLSGFLGAAS